MGHGLSAFASIAINFDRPLVKRYNDVSAVAQERRLKVSNPEASGRLLVRAEMYYVYILISKKDKRLYIGYTHDLKRRLVEHSRGNVESTKDRRPLELLGYEAYHCKDDAASRERYLKSGGKPSNELKLRYKSSIEDIIGA